MLGSVHRQDICLAYIVYCCFSHRSAVVSTKCGQCYTKQAVYASSCECRTLRFGSHSTDSHNAVMLTSHTRRITWHLTMSSGSYRMGQIILRVLFVPIHSTLFCAFSPNFCMNVVCSERAHGKVSRH